MYCLYSVPRLQHSCCAGCTRVHSVLVLVQPVHAAREETDKHTGAQIHGIRGHFLSYIRTDLWGQCRPRGLSGRTDCPSCVTPATPVWYRSTVISPQSGLTSRHHLHIFIVRTQELFHITDNFLVFKSTLSFSLKPSIVSLV